MTSLLPLGCSEVEGGCTPPDAFEEPMNVFLKQCSPRGEEGLPVAAVGDRFSSLADGLSAVSSLAAAGALGTGDPMLAGAGPQNRRTQSNSYGGDHRFAVGQVHRNREARGYDAG